MMHNNCLELLGGAFAVKAFGKASKDIHNRLRMDNTTAMSYINKMGGTHSHTLAKMLCSLCQWCLRRGIVLSAEHLPGSQNAIADRESQTFHSSAEWQLHKTVFQNILTLLGQCQVDLFATCLNQLPQYVSCRPDPSAMATDAFQVCWTNLDAYAFPPFSLVGRCLQKVRPEQSTLIVVAPVWPAQAWYPLLLELLLQHPVLLPSHPYLLRDPFGQPHPLLMMGQLQLAAWKVSGIRLSRYFFGAYPHDTKICAVECSHQFQYTPPPPGMVNSG